MNVNIILLIHAAATLYLVGLIWFVQLVHYPLMEKVGEQGYSAYQELHERKTTWAVAPAMLIELACSIGLVIELPASIAPWFAWLGLVLVVLLWLSTALLQVPCHRKLREGFHAAAYRKLVATNWIRTALWSARGVLALWMLM